MSDNIEINNNQDINKFPQAKIKKEQIPKMNVKKLSNLSDSIINYFVISICLILHSAFNGGNLCHAFRESHRIVYAAWLQ